MSSRMIGFLCGNVQCHCELQHCCKWQLIFLKFNVQILNAVFSKSCFLWFSGCCVFSTPPGSCVCRTADKRHHRACALPHRQHAVLVQLTLIPTGFELNSEEARDESSESVRHPAKALHEHHCQCPLCLECDDSSAVEDRPH